MTVLKPTDVLIQTCIIYVSLIQRIQTIQHPIIIQFILQDSMRLVHREINCYHGGMGKRINDSQYVRHTKSFPSNLPFFYLFVLKTIVEKYPKIYSVSLNFDY